MSNQQLTLADVAHFPRPGMNIPGQVKFTPDNQKIAYLQGKNESLAQELWTYDLASGERKQLTNLADDTLSPTGQFSLEQELRRERSRQRGLGVTSYQFARANDDGQMVLLIPFDDHLYLAHGDDNFSPLAGTEGAIDPQLSPDGSNVAFVCNGELHVLSSEGTGQPRILTNGAEDGLTNGLAEYIAQEEMGRRSGFWWNPDGKYLAFIRANSRHIPKYSITHQGTERVFVEEHRYPFTGAPNAIVQLGIVPIDGNPEKITWMDLGEEEDIYIARVAWRPDGMLTALIQSRDQRSQKLVAFNPATGAANTIIEEHGHPWLNLNDDLRFLNSGEFLWSSERTGFNHLYLYDQDGHEIRMLTQGDWMVTGQVAIDEDQRIVYFQGTLDSPLERHLYAVSLDGGSVQRITQESGWHDTVISPYQRIFVDTWQSLTQPPRMTLRKLSNGELQATLFENEGITPDSFGLCIPEITSFHSSDGVLLYAAIYATDETRSSNQPHPLVVDVYGGPGPQAITDTWGLAVDLRPQYLAQQGYVVLMVDNRGSANRGLAFEGAISRSMGHIEVKDQVDGVRFLSSRPYVDGTRVGIYGWSYGGYMTLRALLLAPDVFKVGISGAPVTFWEGYDSHYTERYMGLPATNESGYRTSSVLPYVNQLSGKLLLVQGLVDENVHARHTMRLIEALTTAGKDYELVIFPEARHMPRNPAHLEYLERKLVEFLNQHLLH